MANVKVHLRTRRGNVNIMKNTCIDFLHVDHIHVKPNSLKYAYFKTPYENLIPKKRPHTSSIVQFIFYFWSFEISRNILRNQKTLSV